ncbi:MAG: diadenylate cyclase CdaA [Lachnospiraceae bacterium]|nr:diadenylate cyclase CdaA [Lachnospiraceae bacterium]
MSAVLRVLRAYLNELYLPKMQVIDVVQILLIALFIYICMVWIQRTRAYTLLKGFIMLMAFVGAAALLRMTAILWIFRNLAPYALTALVIIFHPELRKALESLGNRNIISSILPFDQSADKGQRFSDRTITEIVRAVNEMSEVRTGALIVIEQNILLTDFINTGIILDAEVTSQLLINIFEHNTPLHDGAVVIRGDRIASATCYLPLSENARINKRYGTRHRAGLGISEVSDSFTIIVSEETGRVSYAYRGVLMTGVTPSGLREELHQIQKKVVRETGDRRLRFRKGRKS